MIPRWRSLAATFLHGELGSSEIRALDSRVSRRSDVDSRLREWELDPGVRTAADLLSSALACDDYLNAAKAASYLDGERQKLSPALLRLVEKIAGASSLPPSNLPESDEESLRSQMAYQRRLLRAHPRDAVASAELARLYSIVGLEAKSLNSMRRAVELAGSSRFLLRNAVRMLVHYDSPEEAVHLIRSRGNYKDPWVVSADVALASVLGKIPERIKSAKKLLHKGLLPSSVSELQMSIGRVFLDAGDNRAAKKIMREALEHPTENVIAQAHWLSIHKDIDVVQGDMDLTRRSSEAQARELFFKSDFEKALVPLVAWQRDQAFSSHPAIMGSFVANSCLDDPELGLAFANIGIRANPDEALLLNNKIFSLAKMGKLEGLVDDVTKLMRCANTYLEKNAARATAGLVQLRMGNTEAGVNLYLSSMQNFDASKDLRHMALVRMHLIEELLRIDDLRWKYFYTQLPLKSQLSQYPDVIHIFERMHKGIEQHLARFSLIS